MADQIDQIIAGLTVVQRRVLLDLPLGEFTYWARYSRHRSVRMALNNSGCTEPKREGPVTSWFLVRPTPLGEQVRERLMENRDG